MKQVIRLTEECLRRIVRKCINEEINNGTSSNGGYSHFAVSKTTGKIVNGWDYHGIDPSELRSDKRYYFVDDLEDFGFNPNNIKILSLKSLERQGLDPNDDNNWANGEEDMV
jgi:glycogen synthase